MQVEVVQQNYKAASKISNSYSGSMSYTQGRLWNYITQT